MAGQILYFIIDTFQRRPFVVERDLDDMSREATVAAIAAGNYVERPYRGFGPAVSTLQSVIECDMATGTARDVTAEIAMLVSQAWDDKGEKLKDWQRDFLEQHCAQHVLRAFDVEAA